MRILLVKFVWLASICLTLSSNVIADKPNTDKASNARFPGNVRRVLFLGDSITNAGGYITTIETQLRSQNGSHVPELINVGLPSETCCGLSEPDHPFPRPDVHERLDRVLAKAKADLVVACYGMNDGIYYPFSEERFAAYQKGVNRLIEKVKATGAKLILMTPPAFDPLPLKKKGKLLPAGAKKYAWFSIYENYDSEVLKRYAEWIMQQSDRVELTIDLHTAVNDYVSAKRKSNPDFTMSGDGVHVNGEGHQVLATAILKAWGHGQPKKADSALTKLVAQKQRLMRDAWLSHIGHKRPGVKAGLPIEEATKKAKEIDAKIAALAK